MNEPCLSFHFGRFVSYFLLPQADILVVSRTPNGDDAPYTQQYGQCGTMGDYIYITPNYINGSDFIEDYGPKGWDLL